MKSNYQYTLTTRLGVQLVSPLGEADFQIQWKIEKDGKQYYKQELPSKIVFTGLPYSRLLKLEKSGYRCEYVAITVDRKCDGIFKPWFSGRFSLNDGEWNLSRCQVTIKLDDVNVLACYEDNKSVDVNLLSVISDRRTIAMYDPRIKIETLRQKVVTNGTTIFCGVYAWEGAGSFGDFAWAPYKQVVISDAQGTDPDPNRRCTMTTLYARQYIEQDCALPSPGAAWTYISGCVGSTGLAKYARPASVYDCKYEYPPGQFDFYNMTCKIVGVSDSTSVVDNGVPLESILKYFMDNFCIGYRVRSDFFQINPFVVSDINYVTGQLSKVKFLTFFQKSDVKRPSATGNASIAKYTFEKLINTLVVMFNLRYRIVGKEFIIEHVSRFQPGLGLNLLIDRYSQYVKGKNAYTYDNVAKPIREEFTFMESQGADFVGLPIVYNSPCISKEGRENVKKYAAENVTTDVKMVLSNPDSDSNVVDDNGFVIMAADKYNDTFFLISEPSILELGSSLNNSLAWAQLQRDYYRYDRPMRYGKMNGVETKFLSVVPTKKGDQLVIPLCCDDVFEPDQIITTALGEGTVDQATYSFKNQTLTLDLLYVDDDNLFINTPPIATNDAVTTVINTVIDIDVLANDGDGDPDAVITRVEMFMPPNHGTAVVLPNMKIRYTPAAGYLGQDLFVYKIYDDWNEPSNNALVSIIVKPANQPPVAGDISFSAIINTVLNVPAPGIFGNSHDDSGFTLQDYQNQTTQGGVVMIHPDGRMIYTPATNFIGLDTFTFTLVDDMGLTDNGTVTITVRNPDYPVANNDNYTTVKNGSLSVAANIGVMANDSGTAPLSVIAASKTTALGGTVNISADGSFVYQAPAEVTGRDSFTYTLQNNSGTNDATVFISILPAIYVRFDIARKTRQSIIENCNPGGNTQVGTTQRADYSAYYFSDAGGANPMDITGLGMNLNLRYTNVYNDETTTDVRPTLASGSSQVIYTDYLVLYNYRGCTSGTGEPGPDPITSSYNIKLDPGFYTII